VTEDEVISSAKEHDGRYLIKMSEFVLKEGRYGVCADLVKKRRARWLEIRSAGSEEPYEPGPGIQLFR
jgi:hypothetical protein